MAEQSAGAAASQTQPQEQDKKAAKSSKAEMSRVSQKIDLNTVEVQFGSDAKPGKFFVLDNGKIHGEAEFDGKSDFMRVSLSSFLPRSAAHNFSVMFK